MCCTDPLLRTGSSLDSVAALDDVRLQADRSGTAMELQKETTGIAEH